jgi:hypothetical protein
MNYCHVSFTLLAQFATSKILTVEVILVCKKVSVPECELTGVFDMEDVTLHNIITGL